MNGERIETAWQPENGIMVDNCSPGESVAYVLDPEVRKHQVNQVQIPCKIVGASPTVNLGRASAICLLKICQYNQGY